MKLRKVLVTAAAVLGTLAVVAASVAAPALWLRAEDAARLEKPLPRARQGGEGAPGGEDLYLVRALADRGAMLRAGGPQAGYQQREAAVEDLRPAVNARLTALAKAGVLPPALAGQLAVLLEQAHTRFSFSVDAAGFEQTLCTFAEGPFSLFGLECEPLTGRVVNLWVIAAEGGWRAGAGAAEDAVPGPSSLPAELPAGSLAPAYDLQGSPVATAAGELLQGPEPATALAAYSAWLGLDVLGDWADGDSPYYDRQLVSQKAELQLYLLCQGKVLSLGVAPLAGTAGG